MIANKTLFISYRPFSWPSGGVSENKKEQLEIRQLSDENLTYEQYMTELNDALRSEDYSKVVVYCGDHSANAENFFGVANLYVGYPKKLIVLSCSCGEPKKLKVLNDLEIDPRNFFWTDHNDKVSMAWLLDEFIKNDALPNPHDHYKS